MRAPSDSPQRYAAGVGADRISENFSNQITNEDKHPHEDFNPKFDFAAEITRAELGRFERTQSPIRHMYNPANWEPSCEPQIVEIRPAENYRAPAVARRAR